MTTWDHDLDETPYTWADYQTFRAWYAGDPRRTDTLDAHRARRLCLMVDGLAERSAALEAAAARVVAILIRPYPAAPAGFCDLCNSPVVEGHRAGCALGALAALLDDVGAKEER